MTLPDHCLSVPGCRAPRLPYAGYCRSHGPRPIPAPEPRCVAPLRCYCRDHLGRDRAMLGPYENAQTIKLRLQHLQLVREKGTPSQ